MNVLEKLARAAAARATQTGELQLSKTGYLLVQVPNALARGHFDSLNLPGIELPPGPDGRFSAHITVMTPAEVEQIGSHRISERGKHFSFTVGRLETADVDNRNSRMENWRDISRVWFLKVHSTELQQLRKSYGLPAVPAKPFHITVAVRRRNVLREGDTTKTSGDIALQAVAAKAAAYLCERGGHDHDPILGFTVSSGTRGDRNGTRTQISGDGPAETKAAASECLPQGSVDLRAVARQAYTLCLKNAAANRRSVMYGRTLTEAAKRALKPTEAQMEAGNYRKGHFRFQGLDISIETPKGRRRKPEWEPLKHHYGYIRGTMGSDGDHVDVFIGPNQASDRVYVVDQKGKQGGFDEHKVMLGFSTQEEAKKGYLANYEKGWDGMGTVTGLSMNQFKAWLRDGDQTKPMAEQTYQFKTAEEDDSDAKKSEKPVMLIIRRQMTISIVAPDPPVSEESEAEKPETASASTKH